MNQNMGSTESDNGDDAMAGLADDARMWDSDGDLESEDGDDVSSSKKGDQSGEGGATDDDEAVDDGDGRGSGGGGGGGQAASCKFADDDRMDFQAMRAWNDLYSWVDEQYDLVATESEEEEGNDDSGHNTDMPDGADAADAAAAGTSQAVSMEEVDKCEELDTNVQFPVLCPDALYGMVMATCDKDKLGISWHPKALTALHMAAEHFLEDLFKNAGQLVMDLQEQPAQAPAPSAAAIAVVAQQDMATAEAVAASQRQPQIKETANTAPTGNTRASQSWWVPLAVPQRSDMCSCQSSWVLQSGHMRAIRRIMLHK